MKYFYPLFIFLFCSYGQIVANSNDINTSEDTLQKYSDSNLILENQFQESAAVFSSQINSPFEKHFYTEVSDSEEEEHVKTVFFKRKVIGSNYFFSLFFNATQFSFFHKTSSRDYQSNNFINAKAYNTLYVLFRVFRI
ncbi:hypothetical protein KO500_09965 [Cellulophaga baltica]|uniref:hypothetical protein n=1 Tax=Cellulophaga TaxID=104264 RepID=UPI001C073655|nr:MULTISPECIES: hypothetical protein [Cellulophaga]MBU2996762.1 hypothetical protein [Cellulophaga baltica]MDO6768158.1 hypothetical protein [Cellulophaga sp. 1_MG-2023]